MAVVGVCPYCKEPTGKTELGYLMAVHPHHQAGTAYWAKWYRRERDAGRYQSDIADLLLSVAESKMAGAAKGLATMQALNKQRAVNPGLLRMQELNKQRKAEKERDHGTDI